MSRESSGEYRVYELGALIVKVDEIEVGRVEGLRGSMRGG